MAESFFASLKLELIDRGSWATRTQVRAAVFDGCTPRSATSPPSSTKRPRSTNKPPLTRHSQAVRRAGSSPFTRSSRLAPMGNRTRQSCRATGVRGRQ
jgi:hypothetical protein